MKCYFPQSYYQFLTFFFYLNLTFFFLPISAKQKLDEDLEEIANQVNPSKDLEDTTGSEVKSKETNGDDSVRPSEKLMKQMPVVSYLYTLFFF